MSDSAYTGFLLEFSNDDLNLANGLRKTRIIAVARSVDDATVLANTAKSGETLELIEVGADVLAEARMARIENDNAKLIACVAGLE